LRAGFPEPPPPAALPCPALLKTHTKGLEELRLKFFDRSSFNRDVRALGKHSCGIGMQRDLSHI